MTRPPSRGLVFIASHLGYPMDRTPLGGGAMVGMHLSRAWAGSGMRLAALGSGPEAPFAGTNTALYVRLAPVEEGLVDLSELAYARFCRRFERAATEWLLERQDDWRPDETVVVVNDISEGPDLERLKSAGYKIVSIWHVDVVDYFNKLYLRGLMKPGRVTAFYERLRGLKAAVPDVLKLVFEKQRQTVALSDLMVLPSRAMADTIESCYGGALAPPAELRRRCRVQPWGAVGDWTPADPRRVEALRRHYQIGGDTDVVITLSRISPEKGVDLLVRAFGALERRGGPRRDTVLLVCGEAAFMMGQAYMERVRRAAGGLSKTRVFFPGYLSAADKPAYFALADLFVSPSVHESYGLNVVEALRAGLPVLASDHYGVRDILRETYGMRVPYPSLEQAPEALSSALEKLLADKGRLKRMGTAAAEAAAGMTFEAASRNVAQAAFGLLRKEVLA